MAQAGTRLVLDVSASYDPEGTPLNFGWIVPAWFSEAQMVPDQAVLVLEQLPRGQLRPTSRHEFVAVISDGENEVEHVFRIDVPFVNAPPTLSLEHVLEWGAPIDGAYEGGARVRLVARADDADSPEDLGLEWQLLR